MSEPLLDRLSATYQGDGFRFAYPAHAVVEDDVDERVLDSAVIADRDEPVLIAVAVEDSPVVTPRLQVPAVVGSLLRKYHDKGGFEELSYRRVVVAGSDAAEAAEFTYGTGDTRQVLLAAARLDGPRTVTLQVHFPPSTAARNRPLTAAILDSLVVG